MSLASKRTLGNRGETQVVEYLQSQGFTILARNYLIRGGEIDIIATKKELLIFVEVKTRTQQTHSLSEVVTLSKQKKIIYTAKHFSLTYGSLDKVLRFDVALVQGSDAIITYLPNAFTHTDW